MLQPGDELGRSVCIEKAEQSELIERIRDTVRTGILGEDYTIIPRDKNRWLRRDYNITDIRIRQILLDLQMEDLKMLIISFHEDNI